MDSVGHPYLVAFKMPVQVLTFGLLTGSIAGSVLGGRWSDRQLAKLKDKNGGLSKPEVSEFCASSTIIY